MDSQTHNGPLDYAVSSNQVIRLTAIYRCMGEDTIEILHQFPEYQRQSDPRPLDSGMWRVGLGAFRHDSLQILHLDGGQARYRVGGKDVQRDELKKEIDHSTFLVLFRKMKILWSHSSWLQPRHECMYLVCRYMGITGFG